MGELYYMFKKSIIIILPIWYMNEKKGGKSQSQ